MAIISILNFLLHVPSLNNHLSTYLSIYTSIHLSIYLNSSIQIHLFNSLSKYIYINLSICLFMYRVFIRYCVFLKILIYIPNSVFSRCQCVYTRQAGRTPALQQNWQSSENSKIFKEKHDI